MGFYLAVGFRYVAQYVKGRLIYGADFWTGVFSDLIFQTANLLFLLVVFDHVPAIHGWRREEILFIYGYFLVPFALFNATAANLWDFADRYVVRGEMDRVLTRPLPALFQVLLETFEAESLLGVFTGAALMGWAGSALDIEWRWWDGPLLLALVVGSAMVYFGIFVALASVAFWADGRTGLIPLVWNLNSYGRYPVEIYRGSLRFVLTWVLPLAFAGFYPAAYLLRHGAWHVYALLTPVVGAAAFALGLLAWRAGIRRYRGAGS